MANFYGDDGDNSVAAGGFDTLYGGNGNDFLAGTATAQETPTAARATRYSWGQRTKPSWS